MAGDQNSAERFAEQVEEWLAAYDAEVDDEFRAYLQDLYKRFGHFLNKLWLDGDVAETWFRLEWVLVMTTDGEIRLVPPEVFPPGLLATNQ